MKYYSGLIAASLMLLMPLAGQGAASGAKPAGHPNTHAPVAAAAPQSSGNISGKVLETMDSGGYSYVNLQKDNGDKLWLAVPSTKVVKGSTMTFQPGMEMVDFKSKSLNRSFDTIIFSNGVAAGSQATEDKPSPGSKGAVVSVSDKIQIEKASGPNAHTVADIYKQKGALDKKKIAVKGKVVKVSNGIMGRNWIHLQDGSGDAKKGTHNLVVTSQEKVKTGDVVTASGIVAKDKDFGGGYRYDVIIEEATITTK